MPQNMTPEEIQAEIQKLAEGLKDGTKTAEDFAAGLKDAQKGVKEYTATMAKFRSDLASSGKLFATSMYEGKQGMDAYSNSVDAAGNAAWEVGKAFGPLGMAAGALVKAFTFLFTAASKQSDALFKSYQDISRVGVAFDGLKDLQSNMQSLGYGIDELATGGAILAENAQALASLSGTVGEGAKVMAGMAKEIRTSNIGTELQVLGYSVDDMNKGIAGYLKLQQQVGKIQLQTNGELMSGAAQYMKSADELSKVTGLSLKAQMDIEAKAKARETYGAYARQQQRMGKGANITELDKLTKVLEGEGLGKVGEGIQDMMSGAMGSPETRAAMLSLPGMMEEVNRQKQMGIVDANALHTVAIRGLKASSEMYDGAKAFGASVGTFDSATYNAGLSAERGGTLAERTEAAKATQAKVQGDKQMQDQVKLRESQRDLRDQSQDLVSAFGELVDVSGILSKVMGGIARFFGMGKTLDAMSAQRTVAAGGGTAGGSAAMGAGGSDSAAKAMAFFKSQGWSDAQAAGIVGNLQAESGKNLNTKAVGDSGKAKGIGQWHPDRQKKFAELTGKSLDESSLEEQLRFVDWELKNTEKKAGDKLKEAQTAAQAAAITDKYYERSSGAHLTQRISNAMALDATASAAATAAPADQRKKVEMADAKQAIRSDENAKKPSPPDQGSPNAEAASLAVFHEMNANLRTMNDTQKKILSRTN